MRSRLSIAASALAGAVALTGCGRPAPPAPTPSVLVRTQPIAQGAVPDVAEVYGAAAPASGTLQTLNLNQPASVDAILVAPGTMVKAGQRLLTYTLDPASLSAYQQATAALRLAQAQETHTSALFAQQLATRDQVAQSEAGLRSAQANLAALAKQGAGVGSGAISAPVDGVVASIPVATGDRVASGGPLMTIARGGGLVITAGFDPAAAGRLQPGQPATVESLAGGQVRSGRVLRVSGALNPRTRLLDADIVVSGGGLILGEAFRASVTIGQVAGWIAPHASVLNDGQQDYVFQVIGGKARRVDVSVVRNAGAVDVIQGPLDRGLPLVTEGAYQLAPGAKVRTGAAP